MARPTIRDLAEAAGVSIATVNRVISGAGKVRQPTMQHVHEVAKAIGFYAVGAIEGRIAAVRSRYKFGFLLHQPGRAFYQNIATELRQAAARRSDCQIDAKIEFLEDLSPQNVATQMIDLAENCDAIAVVAAVHPLVTQAIETLQERGIPVFAIISQLEAAGQVHYIGLDGWKVGRTAGWACEHLCKEPGKLGILVGNHRYRCQEMNESGFRSYIREFAPDFTVLEPLSTFESKAVAQEMTERLLRDEPDLKALYVAGGGISGALEAVRNSDRAGKLIVIGYELMDVTRRGLLDGTMTFAISHPLTRLADETISGMIKAATEHLETANYSVTLPFELYTRENI